MEIEKYGKGGLYPIDIGDFFENDRYEILNKLGVGTHCTIWAARDHWKKCDVAIKAIQAKCLKNNRELLVLQHLQNADTKHPGAKYVMKLLDHFYKDSFGQKCLFLVLEQLGPTLYEALNFQLKYRYSISSARRITKQLLLAVDYLHTHGVVHGDIHDRNIAFRLPDDCDLLIEDEISISKVAITETSREGREGLPKYLVEPFDFKADFDQKNYTELKQIQIIDFSSAFLDSDPPKSLMTVKNMTPPECIFKKPLSNKADIWNIACTIFWVTNAYHLFYTCWSDKRVLIPSIAGFKGESSAYWLLTALIDAIHTGAWKNLPTLRFPLDDSRYFPQFNGSDMDSLSDEQKEYLPVFEQFLQKASIADPSKRPTAEQLQAEEWVQVPAEVEDSEDSLDSDDS